MTRVQFVQFESDAPDIGALLAAISRGMGQAMEIEPRPAPAAQPMLAAPAKARKSQRVDRRKLNGKAATVDVVPDVPPQPALPMIEFLRGALVRQPMSLSECVEHLRAHGFDSDSQRCSATIQTLRRRNLVYRDDADGRWHAAVKAERMPCAKH